MRKAKLKVVSRCVAYAGNGRNSDLHQPFFRLILPDFVVVDRRRYFYISHDVVLHEFSDRAMAAATATTATTTTITITIKVK